MPAALALTALLAMSTAAADVYASRETPASKQARAGETEFRALYEELRQQQDRLNTQVRLGQQRDNVAVLARSLNRVQRREQQ